MIGANLDRRMVSIAGLALLAIFFVAINMFFLQVFRGASVDLTENKLFTLSGSTRSVLNGIDEPITLRFFYSEALGESVAGYGVYGTHVHELLERYTSIANGGIKLRVYDPKPFSDEEDLAVAYGLQGVPINQAGDLAYFGLVGTNSTDDQELIAFFQPEREGLLEYDLSRLIANLAHPDLKVVGIMSSLPIFGTAGGPRGPQPPWLILDQLRQRFSVRGAAPDTNRIEDDIDVLMIVHPKSLPDETLYAIDQFVLRGGRVMAFVDPHAESDPAGRAMSMGVPTKSDLPKLLDAWGIEIPIDTVIGDREAALRINTAGSGRMEIVDYLAWLSLGKRNLNPEDVVTADLSRLVLASVGEIKKKPDATTEFMPLILSSPQSMAIDANKVRMFPDFKGLLADFRPADREFVLAARIRGPAKSAFPEGRPPSIENDADAQGAITEPAPEQDSAMPHLAESEGPINVIVVADADLLEDRFWIQVQDFFGQRIVTPTADNADFILNALDQMTGSEALIGLRSRGESTRPFELVREIQSEAELRYRATERELQSKLDELEAKLSELRTVNEGRSILILSDEQKSEIQQIQVEMLSTRQKLREVQRALREDIDQLETELRFLNIGLIPLLVAIAAIVMALWRRRNRKRHVAMA